MSYTDNSKPVVDALRVWWIPQIPMTPFYRAVDSPTQAIFLMDALAYYDMFQFENKIKPDYCNAGGLEIYRDGEWEEWESDEGDDIDVWARSQAQLKDKPGG